MIINLIEKRSGGAIEPDIPAHTCRFNPPDRLNPYLDAMEMSHPCFYHAAQGELAGAPEIDAQCHVVTLVAPPVQVCVFGLKNIEFDGAQGSLGIGYQPPEIAVPGTVARCLRLHFDCLQISQQHLAVGKVNALLAKEKFGSARHQTVTTFVEHVAQDHLRELIGKQRRESTRREIAGLPRWSQEEIAICVFERPHRQQMVAKRQHYLVVFAGVGVSQCRQFRRRDCGKRIGLQAIKQRSFRDTGVGHRRDFRTREVRPEQVLAWHTRAGRVAGCQMKAGMGPEVGHASRDGTEAWVE